MCSQDEKYFEGKLLQLCDTVNMASAGDVNTPATVVLKDKEVQATGKYWTKYEKDLQFSVERMSVCTETKISFTHSMNHTKYFFFLTGFNKKCKDCYQDSPTELI